VVVAAAQRSGVAAAQRSGVAAATAAALGFGAVGGEGGSGGKRAAFALFFFLTFAAAAGAVAREHMRRDVGQAVGEAEESEPGHDWDDGRQEYGEEHAGEEAGYGGEAEEVPLDLG
jgi:hypothetical protein